MDLDDLQLVQRARSNPRAGFDPLMQRYFPKDLTLSDMEPFVIPPGEPLLAGGLIGNAPAKRKDSASGEPPRRPGAPVCK